MTQTFIKIGATSYDAADYTIPAERTFRGAWEANADTGVISVDMAAARDIWRDKIRAERSPRLDALDTDWFRAAETNDTEAQSEIAAKKQALRDVTKDPRIDAADTPDSLSALTLDVLLG